MEPQLSESTFAARLAKACDLSPNVPDAGRGRGAHIANLLGVSQEAASRWFNGESVPRRDKVRQLASYLGVEESWLSLGVSPEMDRRAIRTHARNTDGAALFVRGLMVMSGAACADPDEHDPRAAFVDFYAIIKQKQYAVRVAFARPHEPTSDELDVHVPSQFRDCYNLLVAAAGRGWFDVVHLPADIIDRRKRRRAGDYVVTVERRDGRYSVAGEALTRIRNFGDLT